MITAKDELLHTIESSGMDDAWRAELRNVIRKTNAGEQEALCQLLDVAGGYDYAREEAAHA